MMPCAVELPTAPLRVVATPNSESAPEVVPSRSLEDPPTSPELWLGALTGYARGIEQNADIEKFEGVLTIDYRWFPALGLGASLGVAQFFGDRDGRQADSTSVLVLPTASWFFARGAWGSLSFDFGYGGGFFSPAFPPGGTPFNGYSMAGFGVEFQMARQMRVGLKVRFTHHSNGQGFVGNNPAFDGVGLQFGLSREVLRAH